MGPAADFTCSAIMGGILGWSLWYICGDREQQKAILPLVICAGAVVGVLITAASRIVLEIHRWGSRLADNIRKQATEKEDPRQEPDRKDPHETRFCSKDELVR